MQYGFFDDKKKEYIITNPKTPVKWINYLGTLEFGGYVDQTGGSLLCKGDPALNRITRYFSFLPSFEMKGETLYLRIKEKKGWKIFSPFYVPTLDPWEKYECHVGLGYNRYVTRFYGIECDILTFIPVGGNVCIRRISIKNKRKQSISLDAIPVVDYTHPDALKQITNADWVPQTMQSKIVEDKKDFVILLQYPFMFRDIKVNFFTSNQAASSYETDRVRFLGDSEYGTWQHPASLDSEELENTQALRGDNIAALMHHFPKVKPSDEIKFITLLGQSESLEKAMPVINKYRNSSAVDSAFAELKDFWEEHLSRFQIQTPDKDLNRMLNIHNPRQCYTTKNWSRYLSLYQTGYGSARGIGVRDSSQDIMGVLDRKPQEGRDLLRKIISVQKRDGSAMHQFNPATMEATEGDSLERPDRPHYYSDDHLWMVWATCAYCRETGDLSFLDEVIPFYDKDQNKNPLEKGAVLEHLQRALHFTKTNVGRHGIPLLGFADWNDCVNLATGAESMFSANLYGKALCEMKSLFEFLGKEKKAGEYQSDYDTMKKQFNQCGWDGEWFVRYFDFNGTPLGSQKNEQGKIYLNGQSWPIISGFAETNQGRKALDSVYRLLNTKNGIKLSAPGFNGFDPAKGGVTTYPPGAKENGGIFLHPNPWAMMAETILGNGERAYEYYCQINPSLKNDKIDEYQCEPYVYAQNILGDEHPLFGLGRNSWLSGTASWMYQAATQYILGIRPDYKGLIIDPCIPKKWDGFTAIRKFRSAIYNIMVRNPKHVNRGVKSMTVDGKKVQENCVGIFKVATEHHIEITMGEIQKPLSKFKLQIEHCKF